MIRYAALLGLHFLVNFALLDGNVVVSHPIHHDDYSILGASIRDLRVPMVRPVSTLAIAVFGDVGDTVAFLLLNLALVACVLLCIRFVELLVRDGRRLPLLGFVAAGALALGFSAIVDWTKYMGLITNLTSALTGLAAMCALALAANDPRRERTMLAAGLALATISFFGKEDFGAPLVALGVLLAALKRSRPWTTAALALPAMFIVALLFNRGVGSVFVSGTTGPGDPYYVDLSPSSLVVAFARMLFATTYENMVIGACLAVLAVAIVVNRANTLLAIRLAALPAIAVCMLSANTIFPNHAFAYYAFVPFSLMCVTLVAAAYAVGERGTWR